MIKRWGPHTAGYRRPVSGQDFLQALEVYNFDMIAKATGNRNESLRLESVEAVVVRLVTAQIAAASAELLAYGTAVKLRKAGDA